MSATLTQTIGSYLYSQYQDDDDLQAFVTTLNTFLQNYLNTFNQLDLPIFPDQTGALLDWVCNGLYGYPRPVFPSGTVSKYGPFNSFLFNFLPFNGSETVGTSSYISASDDVYIRCLCWNFYKADGQAFTIPWLKRRIARFLYWGGLSSPGVDSSGYLIGTTWSYTQGFSYGVFSTWYVDPSGLQNISVSFRANSQVAITITGSPEMGTIFKLALMSGALSMPFQFSYVISV
jgi:hypothetical protein